MKVSELMEKHIYTCGPQANLENVAMLMWNHDCGSIPVVDNGNRPVGMITDRDISIGSALNHQPLWDMTTAQVTDGREVFTCGVDDKVKDALAIMESKQVRRLPVIDGDGHLAGMLSIKDVVYAAAPSKSKNNDLSYNDVMDLMKAVCSSQNIDKESSEVTMGVA